MAEAELTALSVEDFLDRLASGDPTPGGGSAAAVGGALAAALVSMVCNLTVGRDKFADVERDVRVILERAEELRRRLRAAVQADAAAFAGVMAAFRLPRATDAEQAARGEAIQVATRAAAGTPLEIAEDCAAVLALCEQAVGITNPNAASDIAVAALLAGAALEAGVVNVEVNLDSIKDAEFTADLRQRTAVLRSGREERVAAILNRTRPTGGG